MGKNITTDRAPLLNLSAPRQTFKNQSITSTKRIHSLSLSDRQEKIYSPSTTKERQMPCHLASMNSADPTSKEDDPLPLFLSCKTHPLVSVGKFQYQECDSLRLGEGSYGVVFKGRNSLTGDSVAIKKVPSERLKPGEVALMRSLNKSQFLVALLDCIQRDSRHTFVVMELCDTDLEGHLSAKADNGRLRDLNFRVLLKSLAQGYGVLFRENIVHRDIKPQNILLKYATHCPHPQIAVAKITDFGISRVLEPDQEGEDHGLTSMHRVHSSASLSNVAGTPYYMAPEVGANIIGEMEYDFRVDMWSIGCVLYECITGQPPFDEQRLCKLFLKAACFNFHAYSIPELPSGTPSQLSLILESLLEMDAEKRLRPPEFYCAALIYTSEGIKNRRHTFSSSLPLKDKAKLTSAWRHSVPVL